MRLDIYHHSDRPQDSRFDCIIELLREILEQGKRNMALNQQSLDLLSQIDTATTEVATRIEQIIAEDDDAELQAKLQPHLDRLKALAHDPNAPVPPAPTDEE